MESGEGGRSGLYRRLSKTGGLLGDGNNGLACGYLHATLISDEGRVEAQKCLCMSCKATI